MRDRSNAVSTPIRAAGTFLPTGAVRLNVVGFPRCVSRPRDDHLLSHGDTVRAESAVLTSRLCGTEILTAAVRGQRERDRMPQPGAVPR